MRKAAARARLLACALSGLVLGCAHRPEGPAAAVAAFGAAVARGDLPAAYALTSTEFRQRIPFQAFAAGFKAGGAEPATMGQRMVAESARIAPRVEIELSFGERVPMLLEDGRWRIDGPVYEAWGQGTPRAALRTFVRALDEGRYDVVLRLVPNRYRAGLSVDELRAFWEGARKKEHAALLAELRASLNAPIVESEDEAHLPSPSGREIRLVREGGQWKVEDPDQNHLVTTGER